MSLQSLKEKYNKIPQNSFGARYIKEEGELEELGIKAYKSHEGSNYLTFLPQPDGSDFFGEIHVHYDVGAGKDSFLCLARTYNQPCPICDFREKLKDAGEPKDIWKQMYPAARFLFYVVDVTSKETVAQGIQVFDAPKSIMLGIIGVSKNPRTHEIVDVSDPSMGSNLVYNRQGKGQHDTKYTSFQLEKTPEAIPESFYEAVPQFDESLNIPNPADVAASQSMPPEAVQADDVAEELPTPRATRTVSPVDRLPTTNYDGDVEEEKVSVLDSSEVLGNPVDDLLESTRVPMDVAEQRTTPVQQARAAAVVTRRVAVPVAAPQSVEESQEEIIARRINTRKALAGARR